MNATQKQRPTIMPRDRQEWRAWLEQNYASAAFIWVVLNKKFSPTPGLLYEEAVEEALCFGWIDSTANKFDEFHTVQYFAPRKPKSTWARSNKERVERLITQGRMTGAGLASIAAAKQDGSWTALDEIDALLVPGDLQAALDANPEANINFAAFSPSSRKQILYWISSAKQAGTRARRIAETVQLAAQNIKARG